MFFHHDRLMYFLNEIEKLLALFETKPFKDKGYPGKYASLKDEAAYTEFFSKVVPGLKRETAIIDKHIASEKNLLKSVHKSIIYEHIAVKMENFSELSDEEKEIHTDLGLLHQLHENLSPLVRVLANPPENNRMGWIENLHTTLTKLHQTLKDIREISIKIGAAMKVILEELDEAANLLKRDRTNFKRNMKSWIHLAE